MKIKNKKLAVLHQLSQESEPISLPNLLQQIGGNYSERSLRRWLEEMVKEGLIQKFGQKRGTKYQVIKRVDRNKDGTSGCFSPESITVIERTKRPLYERNPVTYDDDWFEEYIPNVTYYFPEETRIKLHKAGQRAKHEDPAGTYARHIYNRLLIDLSYNSSRLEGNTYSLLDTQKLILEGSSAEGKLDEEKVMILNHKEAIRYLVDSAPRLEVSKQTICTLHYLLADGLVEPRYAGKLRDHGVRIGGSTYIPFEDPKELQIRLDRIIEKAASIGEPYEQSLFLLVHLSYLQAFTDVNKRTARLSANIPLIKNNLVPLSFNDVERDDYTSAIIAIYEILDVRPIVDLYTFSYMRTCAMYDTTVKAMGFDEIRVRYRQQRRALIRDIILHKISGKAMETYVSSQALRLVGEQNQTAFIEDVLEDIKEIDQSRLIGLGITPEQLNEWMMIQKESNSME